uniref:OmpA-like domain-containing protein n=1 Tax=candidate division WOR-3 bacterium TaxID=2052148 RepID=A0A7C3Z2Z9_UNCW3
MRNFLLFLLSCGLVFADPALSGGRGLFRVEDARVEEDGALVFATRWLFHRTRLNENALRIHGPLFGLEMNYAPFPFIEVFGSFLGVMDAKTYPFRLYYDWQGQNLGAKLSYPYLPVAKLALVGNWLMEKSSHEIEFMDGLYRKGKYWRAVASFRFWELYKTLPTLMLNYGSSLGEENGYSFLGCGLEMASDAVDIFIEANSEKGEGVGFFAKEARARITPGVRVRIPYFHLTGGVELGLTDSVPDYEAILGFSFISPFPKPPRKPWGRLAGKVVDARTGMPLEATISFPNQKLHPLTTDPKTGIFFLQKAPVGVIVVEATKDGYIPEAVPLVITDGGFANYTFNLKPLVPYGTVAGRVFDAYTRKPMAAKITFSGLEIPPATSNPTTGFFQINNVPAGLVYLVAEKEGYFSETRMVEVEDGGITKLEIGLAPLDMKGIFQGKVVDKKSQKPVAATISFVEGEKPPILTDTITGEFKAELPVGSYQVKIEAPGYVSQTSNFSIKKGEVTERKFELVSKGMVLTLKGVYFDFARATLRTESYPALMEAIQILKDNPDIQVEIQGHTDNIGSDAFNQKLSERRAYAVMNFLIQYGGISPARLSAKGYGEKVPIASNETPEGRQLNRRVDFVILK